MNTSKIKMKVIVGLGNPGNEYAQTRHNFGFLFVDGIAQSLAGNGEHVNWKMSKKFNAELAEFTLDDNKILLVKPQTFYNLVGESARKIRDFYKLSNADFLVIHDELALPLGTLRTRIGGSDAGNNGVKNLIANLGPNFARIRIGSGTPQGHDGASKPPAEQNIDIVLGHISKNEAIILTKMTPAIREIVSHFMRDDFRQTTIKFSIE